MTSIIGSETVMPKSSPPRAAYPRPMLERPGDWASLDGAWSFAFGQADASHPDAVRWDREIRVPFSPETPASGLDAQQRFDTCWYRRSAEWSADQGRTLLHFEAVDERAEVWVNGQHAGRVAGPVRQTLDVTGLLDGDLQEIAVRVFDDPSDMTKPRGKQDWEDRPHSIWYPRTTGLWQSVWLERVPACRIDHVAWRSNVERWEIELECELVGPIADGWLEVELSIDGRRLARDRYSADAATLSRVIRFPDPGINDARERWLWSPDRPTLIDVQLRLLDADGQTLDHVLSYTAMRSFQIDGDRFLLNGSPCHLRMVLAQGYWAETGLTAPDDRSLRRDVELTRELGFNGVRLHEKVESQRYLYWADRLGLMVWGEMGSAYAFRGSAFAQAQQAWAQRVRRDASHPSVVAWVPINESWGLPDLPRRGDQRHALASMYHLTKALDPDRPVVGNDGWEMGPTDVIALHDYDGDPDALAQRYDLQRRGWDKILADERPGHRRLLLEGERFRGQPVVLSEFGGICLREPRDGGAWGYSEAVDPEAFGKAYARLLEQVNRLPGFAGFCYTQFTDTYQEANGLLKMDRTPKLPIAMLAALTRGQEPPATGPDASSNGHPA